MARRPIEISLFGGDVDLTRPLPDPPWITQYGEFWVGVAALVAALFGVGFAVKAWLDARDSLATAEEGLATAKEGLRIAQKEHAAFMKQLTARADFKLGVEKIVPPWGDLPLELINRAGGTSMRLLMFRLSIQNSGDRAAGPTILNFIMGPKPDIAYWSSVNGRPKKDAPQDVIRTPDEVLEGTLEGEDPVYLARVIDRVSRKGVLILHVAMVINTDKVEGTSFEVRFTAQADELPDDVEDRSKQIRVENVLLEPLT